MQSELGFVSDAEAVVPQRRRACRSENLPLPEQYLISASHARIMKNNKQAMDAYENLAKSWPSDVDVQYNLGTLYVSTGDYAKARDMFAKILEADPKNIKALWEMGVVENTLGNPQSALDSLSKGINLATQVGNQEQKALILLSTGISYRLLNRPDEAMRNVEAVHCDQREDRSEAWRGGGDWPRGRIFSRERGNGRCARQTTKRHWHCCARSG